MEEDPAIEGLIQQGKMWECQKCNYMSNIGDEHFDFGCINCTKINPHEESVKKMDPFMNVITDLNIAIDSLVIARQRLVEAMCNLADYPQTIVDAVLKTRNK
jgi:hypothetical protein